MDILGELSIIYGLSVNESLEESTDDVIIVNNAFGIIKIKRVDIVISLAATKQSKERVL